MPEKKDAPPTKFSWPERRKSLTLKAWLNGKPVDYIIGLDPAGKDHGAMVVGHMEDGRLRIDSVTFDFGAPRRARIKWRFFFAWYDLWVGFYWSAKDRTLYFCPFPTLAFAVTFP
jgi:hypothetical protein